MKAKQRKLLFGGLALLVVLAYADSSAAQVIHPNLPQNRVQPIQPKLSPYLNLLREDTSVNSPYHTFVLPRREVAQEQLRQAAEISSIQRLVPERATAASRSRVRTGTGGHFNTYLHFYGSNGHP